MAKDYAKSFYKSTAWKKSRAAYIQSVGGLCERHLKKNRYVPGKVLHHKTYISKENINNPDVTLDWDNFEYLCQECHNQEHHANELVNDGLKFDSNGNLIQI